MIVNPNDIIGRTKTGNKIMFVFSLLTPIVGALLELAGKVDKIKHPTFGTYLAYVQDYAIWIFVFLIMILFVGIRLTRRGDSTAWAALQQQLDKLQAVTFHAQSNDVSDAHRVTLFIHKRTYFGRHGLNPVAWWKSCKQGKCPNSGWLIPILRSNHQGKHTKVAFCITDTGDKTEGVAGQCWARNSVLKVDRLPNLINSSSPTNRERYAKKSHIPLEMVDNYVNNGKRLARSFIAYPVYTGSGNYWGVLVWDSASETIDDAEAEKAFKVMVETLGVLLEGVK